MKFKIGIIGSAQKEDEEIIAKARDLGKSVAEKGCILVTGSSTGVPYEAAKAAKLNGGFVIGMSPAHNEQEHTEHYKYPLENFDVIVYTGFGKKGRNVIEIRSCDAVIFLSGGSGSLNEFTIAYDEGKVCGVLLDSGGITEVLKDIEEKYLRGRKASGKVLYDTNPERLIGKILEELKS